MVDFEDLHKKIPDAKKRQSTRSNSKKASNKRERKSSKGKIAKNNKKTK